MQTEWIRMTDGEDLFVRVWAVDEPKAIVQLAHGMAEHSLRYDRFAQKLNQAGFTVIASDHRGHGETGRRASNLGDFPQNHGWNRVVEDLSEIRSHFGNRWNEKEFYLVGHSMGSFLSRSLIAREGERFAGVILSGTAGSPGLMGVLGKGLANLQMPLAADWQNPLLDKLSFGAYNRAFQPNRTAFDWLSRDEGEVDAYIEDPLCGFVCTTRFYRDLIGGLIDVNDPDAIRQIPKSLRICLMAGSQDPVGDYGNGVREVAEKYRAADLSVTMELYPDARHEILNEINRDEVMDAMIGWINHE